MLVIRHQMRGGSVQRHQKEGHVIRIYWVMLKVVEPDRYFLAVLQQSSHQSLHLQTINALLQKLLGVFRHHIIAHQPNELARSPACDDLHIRTLGMHRTPGSQHYICIQNGAEHGVNLQSFGDLSEVLLKVSHGLSATRSLGLSFLHECPRPLYHGQSLRAVALLPPLIHCHLHPNETQ
jgi:hypothetical protein